jgi:hypothetical protein
MQTVGLSSKWHALGVLFVILVPLVGCDVGTAPTDGTVTTAAQDLAMFFQDFARQILAAFLL